MKEDFKLYYNAGERFYSKMIGFISVLFEPGFYAIIMHRAAHYLHEKRIPILPLIIMRINKLMNHVDISYEAVIGKRLRMPHCFDIVIGSTAVIGNDVEILNGVTLGAIELRSGMKRHPTIENNVLIGAGAKILGNVTIGKNSKIGSNAVVTKSVPAGSTAIGVPARIV